MKRNLQHIILLAAYIVFTALPFFHFHPLQSNSHVKIVSDVTQSSSFDPFRIGDSDCSVAQIGLTKASVNSSYHSSQNVYCDFIEQKYFNEFEKLNCINYSQNGWRAPPINS